MGRIGGQTKFVLHRSGEPFPHLERVLDATGVYSQSVSVGIELCQAFSWSDDKSRAGRELGSVVTLRDRTELEGVLRLDEVRDLTDALRAQQDEFSNRMHVLSGLLELGRYSEAIGYASEIIGATEGLAAELEGCIGNARIVALLVAKTTVARERGVTLIVTYTSVIEVDDITADALVSVIGNLIDNGIDAATDAVSAAFEGAVPTVMVRLGGDGAALVVDVSDSGAGIPAGAAESVFARGWSTKHRPEVASRGIGLALVRQLVLDLGGEIHIRELGEVSALGGAHFRAVLPFTRAGGADG